MIVELQRAFSPEELYEDDCGICGERFRSETVIAMVSDDSRMDLGRACPACVECLGRRGVSRFPTIEEYRAALARYPEPMWATDQAAARAEEDGTFAEAFEASWIRRGEA